jgi:hypothetical protein
MHPRPFSKACLLVLLALAGFAPHAALARAGEPHAVPAYLDCSRFHIPVFQVSRGRVAFTHLLAVHYCGTPESSNPSDIGRPSPRGGFRTAPLGGYQQ